MRFQRLRLALAEGLELPTGIRQPQGERAAGVLILFTDTPDPEVTLTIRASTLRRHAGQIAFPGGRQDPEDASVEAAALREAQEEVGLDPELVQVLGSLPAAWVPASRYDVTPVVGVWDGSRPLAAVDTFEVERVVQVPVSELADPEHRVMGRHPSGFVGPTFLVDDLVVWGFTGYLLDIVIRAAGWEHAWDRQRVLDVPERFLQD